MTQPNRNKKYLLILIVLTIVNVAAVLTFVYNARREHRDYRETEHGNSPDSIGEPKGPAFLIRELGFDEVQKDSFHQARNKFRETSKPLFVEMRELNAAMIEELSKEQPDTAALRQMSLRAGALHAQVKMNTIRHFRDVRKIATPEQQEKLTYFYRELISHEGGPMGKGNQHRHRRGQKAPSTE